MRKKSLGTDFNTQILDDEKEIKWEHFHFTLPDKFVCESNLGTLLSDRRSNKEVFERGLAEITTEAIDTVLELIEQGSIYRGEENKGLVESFGHHKVSFNEDDNYCWRNSENGAVAKIRNTSIGTLLVDISEGMTLDQAVRSFESKVAPVNYKRPSGVITKGMIKKAEDEVKELGILEELRDRRYATVDDLTVNNIIWGNRDTKQEMSVFDELIADAPENVKSLDKVEEVHIDSFLKEILPKANSIQLMVGNPHTNNLMSLIAPKDKEAKEIFKWGNNFSWNYNGEVTDSIKEKVKRAGGRVDGCLRFSIKWNDGDNNPNDFDAHAIEPNNNKIFYENKRKVHPSSGMLDTDVINPGREAAVENIIYTDIHRMPEGNYAFLVHNFSHMGGKTGFVAEIEFTNRGETRIYTFEYAKELKRNEKVPVATVNLKDGVFKIVKSLHEANAAKEIWGIKTNTFTDVSMVMNSPNHWDGEKTGNKHYFFILKGCKNDGSARGFFNEFLPDNLREHRKVFEVLGSKMKVEKSDDQLSGLGFSSTQRNHVFCKVSGSFNRVIKINF